MNYYEAAKIRKKGFADLMTDKLTSGQGVFSSVRSTLSDRSKARSMAFKEKFDPLNIAKVLTGGSNLAPAMLGRLLGRKSSDINYFAGKKEYTPRRESSYFNNYTAPSMSSGGSQKATRVLQKMLSFMEKSRTDDMQEQDTLDSFREMNENMREDRHKEVMDVFIEATNAKVRRRFEKHVAKEAKKREKGSKKKEPEVKKETKLDKTESKKQTTPETAEAPKTQPKTQTKTETTPTEKAKPVQTAPTTVPAQSTVTPKLSTVSSAVMGATKSAVKVGAVGLLGTTVAGDVVARIASRESAGNSPDSYLLANRVAIDKNNPNKPHDSGNSNKIEKGAVDVTTNKKFEKSLNEMTIEEVLAVANRRRNYFDSAGAGAAMGKYQFMPGTLEDSAKKEFGVNWKNELFNGENQEKLSLAFIRSNAEKLTQAGVPISDASLYMMHFFGNAQQAKLVLDGADNDSMKDILDYYWNKKDASKRAKRAPSVANPGVAALSVGDYKRKYLSKSFTFKQISINDLGTKANDLSVENGKLRGDLSQGSAGGSPVIIQNNNTTQAKTNIHRAAPQEQLNPTMRH